ncbi:MAG: xanthine dehydrogenase family protein molybdopterin-binding subunit [Candidatus Brocadiae bacterium]|nr:xanthine dehydrogenase family protein molybdopterin-binding subunit [Candidatus Brocadiia bacterium]
MTTPRTVSRRDFISTGLAAAGGLVVGFALPGGGRRLLAGEESPDGVLNAFVRIAADDSVTILLKHAEMGQGISTSLPMAVAEELGCDWSRIRVEHAPAAPAYFHTAFGIQVTGGSTSTWESFEQMRKAGATARVMLVETAAEAWGIPASDCRVENGVVLAGDRRATFGSLAAAAGRRTPPDSVALKAPKDWTLIGKSTKRLEGADKSAGRAVFGLDVRRPGQVFAAVARPPHFGGTVASFDPARAKATPGVVDVVAVPSGVAVIAKSTWAAWRGVSALEVTWKDGPGAGVSTRTLLEEYRALARTPGLKAAAKGDAEAALGKAAKIIEAEYDVPYLAHAPMEPLNVTVELGPTACDIWTGTQMPTTDVAAAARVLGLDPSKIRLHTPWLGGGFGRRANPRADFVAEACEIAKRVRGPVQVAWSREDDIRGGYYRPMWASRLRAALGAGGLPTAWSHTIVGQSIIAGTPFAMMIQDGVDGTSVEGAANSPYLAGIPDFRVGLHSPVGPVPVLWWRSVGHSHTAFVVESFLDELAHAAGIDPLEYRRSLLRNHARHLGVLNLAAETFGWGRPLPEGRAAGLAVHESFGSFVAQAAEVSLEGGRIRVHRVACAVDCGPVVNPAGVEAQMQSGIVFGLTAALRGEITLHRGQVQQSNFHDYPILRLSDMPEVTVRIVNSTEPMGGVGEPGVPPIAPAVANAVFSLTGKRLRSLPLRLP